MPHSLRNSFGSSVTVIIDCFEVFIEKPTHPVASCKTWSNYKHHHTIKYLIGITPQGSICFISEAYGERTSDKFIVEDSGFLNNLQPGDVVVADRGLNRRPSFISLRKSCYPRI